jgi:hypothetical protein
LNIRDSKVYISFVVGHLDVALLRYYALLSRRRVGGVELPTRLGCLLA